ncbi:MAG: hypothetical protein WAO00_14080 [Chthoniobacterales bacterium]
MPRTIAGLKVQCTVDPTTRRVLDEMATLSIHGQTRAEVSSWILREWIWHNQDLLARNGIELRPKT